MNAHRPTGASSTRSRTWVPRSCTHSEQARIRDAADTLIFAASLEDARAALEDADALCEHLVATGRWTEERAAELAQDLLACGPLTPVA